MGLKLHNICPTRAYGDIDGLPLTYEREGAHERVTIAGTIIRQDVFEAPLSIASARAGIYGAIARLRAQAKPDLIA